MSLTIQQILLDAKKLATKLKEHDSAADALLSGTELVYKQIDAMKQYTEDTNVPIESMTTKAHSTLIAGKKSLFFSFFLDFNFIKKVFRDIAAQDLICCQLINN